MAKIYDRSGEHVLINAVREAHIRPFQATDWTDLRVGFFLSVCGNTDPGEDNTIDAGDMAETISGTFLPWTDRVAIGLTDRATGRTFCGYSNVYPGRVLSRGTSQMLTSDIGIGTTNANYWRVKNELGDQHVVKIIDNGMSRANGVTGSQFHLVRVIGGGSEYCTFLGLRFTRPDPRGRARIITMSVKKPVSGFTSDILFTSTPTNAIGETQLQSFPTDVQTLGPVELSQAPDTFYFYWPFVNSRLRIHEVCLLKVA